jgi:kinesin family protein C1
MVQSALDGYNVSLLAYGQTGAGKTWSMMGGGGAAAEGIIPRSIRQILRAVEDMGATGWVYELEGSFLEIYNEGIRDLLISDKDAEGRQYTIRPGDAAAGCMLVGDLTSRKVVEREYLLR